MDIRDFDINDQEFPIVIYGAAFLGSIVHQQLVKMGQKVVAFCDAFKFGNKFQGVDIWHPSQLFKSKEEITIILAIMGNGFFSVAMNLNKLSVKFYTAISLLDRVDYSSISDIEFLKKLIESKYRYVYSVKRYTLYALGNKNSDLFSEYVLPAWDTGNIKNFHEMTLVVTDRCTLKCKECGALASYVRNPRDIPYPEIINPFRKILKCIDYIENLVIVGGETFLYQELEDLLAFCSSSPQIFSITLPTNGTIVPSREILELLRKLHIEVMISEYDLPQCKGFEICQKLLSKGIKTTYRKDSHWFSLHGGEPNGFSHARLRELFAMCSAKSCWNLKHGKLSPCGYAISMGELGMVHDIEEDYIDFSQVELNDMNDINEIKRRMENLLSTPYLKSCFYCKGNNHPIDKVAEQLK